MARITGIEIVAGLLTLVWLVVAVIFGRGDLTAGAGLASGLVEVVLLAMPVVLIWVVARTVRAIRILRAEAASLQSSLDVIRASQAALAPQDSIEIKPAMVAKLDALVQSRIVAAQGDGAVFSSQRTRTQAAPRQPISPATADTPQPGLALAAPVERPPISVADFIKALNFPQD